MKELGVGIVGLGWVAGAHIATFRKVTGARVAAVCSRRRLTPQDVEAVCGTALTAYTDLDEMLADPAVDIVDVCTPHPLHPAQIMAAVRAGKHVIIEKPIAIAYADVLAVRRAVRAAGVKACVCFECRFSRHFQMTRSILDRGLLGDIHFAEVDYYHGIGPWYGQYAWNVRADFGGSSLLTAGCHALDALLFFMEGPVAEVTSYATRSSSGAFAAYEYPTTSVSLLKFESGAVGKVTSCIDCLQPYYFHSHLVGSKGSLLDNRFYSSDIKGMSKERWSTLETSLIDSGDVTDHPYQPQFQAFVDSIHANTTMPLTDLDTAFVTHRVAFAADLSAREGRPVRLAELAAD
jgi:predicted dehydrogenase